MGPSQIFQGAGFVGIDIISQQRLKNEVELYLSHRGENERGDKYKSKLTLFKQK